MKEAREGLVRIGMELLPNDMLVSPLEQRFTSGLDAKAFQGTL